MFETIINWLFILFIICPIIIIFSAVSLIIFLIIFVTTIITAPFLFICSAILCGIGFAGTWVGEKFEENF